MSISEKLPFETNNKFSLRRVESYKNCGHPEENLLQSGLKVGDTWSKLRGHAINTIVGATALTEAIRESCTHPKRSRPIRLGLYSHEVM